jgi:hypothetical protein
VFAALTIASTSSLVMSPRTISILAEELTMDFKSGCEMSNAQFAVKFWRLREWRDGATNPTP